MYLCSYVNYVTTIHEPTRAWQCGYATLGLARPGGYIYPFAPPVPSSLLRFNILVDLPACSSLSPSRPLTFMLRSGYRGIGLPAPTVAERPPARPKGEIPSRETWPYTTIYVCT